MQAKGQPSTVAGAKDGIAALQIASDAPLTQSPEASPTAKTAPGPPLSPTQIEQDPDTTTFRRKRTPSLYSQWDLADAAEESSDEEDEAFLTPTEGLSEVEEEDEEDEGVTNSTLEATNVKKGALASEGDVLGTGPSTIRRSKPSAGETRVRKRAGTKTTVNFDQEACLGKDIDLCREILTLFLTSKMKEAEDMCFDTDPDGNHLYLISAHGIINGLKVGCAGSRVRS